MRRHVNLSIAVCALVLSIGIGLIPTQATAVLADAGAPIEVEADKASYNQRTGVAIYEGRVTLQQGSLMVTADRLIVSTRDGRLEKTEAQGNPARYRQRMDNGKWVNASANTIQQEVRSGIIRLSDHAQLQQDTASFSGQLIVYDSRQQRIDASGQANNRVQLILPPQFNKALQKDRKP